MRSSTTPSAPRVAMERLSSSFVISYPIRTSARANPSATSTVHAPFSLPFNTAFERRKRDRRPDDRPLLVRETHRVHYLLELRICAQTVEPRVHPYEYDLDIMYLGGFAEPPNGFIVPSQIHIRLHEV